MEFLLLQTLSSAFLFHPPPHPLHFLFLLIHFPLHLLILFSVTSFCFFFLFCPCSLFYFLLSPSPSPLVCKPSVFSFLHTPIKLLPPLTSSSLLDLPSSAFCNPIPSLLFLLVFFLSPLLLSSSFSPWPSGQCKVASPKSPLFSAPSPSLHPISH